MLRPFRAFLISSLFSQGGAALCPGLACDCPFGAKLSIGLVQKHLVGDLSFKTRIRARAEVPTLRAFSNGE